MEIVSEIDGPWIKKPYHLKNNVFPIYSPRIITIDTASSIKIDTNIILHLPKKARAFITSKFRGEEIYEVNKEKTRLWIEILNTSYTEDFEIKKKTSLGVLIIKSENLKFKYAKKKRPKKAKGLPKNWEQTWKSYWKKKKKSPKGGFLNRYDFGCTGRDTVNQVGKIAPEIIKKATGEIDKIAQNRINQIIRSRGAEVERVLPKILRGAIEDVYKTPFRMLGNFGKQQFKKLKMKILR